MARGQHIFPGQPTSYDEGNDFDPRWDVSSQHPVHYDAQSDTEGKLRSWRSRTSTARRSRKTSASNRELMRVLVEERLDSERMQRELQMAQQALEALTERAALAERDAALAKARMDNINKARVAAQQSAARAISELQLYKSQYSEAQVRLQQANDVIAESDAERIAADREAQRARKAARVYRDHYLTHQAQEEGRQLGRREGRRLSVTPQTRRLSPLDEDAVEYGLGTRSFGLEGSVDEEEEEVSSPPRAASATGHRRASSIISPVPTRPQSRHVRSESEPTVRASSIDTIPEERPQPQAPPMSRYRSTSTDYSHGGESDRSRLPPVPDHIIVRSPASQYRLDRERAKSRASGSTVASREVLPDSLSRMHIGEEYSSGVNREIHAEDLRRNMHTPGPSRSQQRSLVDTESASSATSSTVDVSRPPSRQSTTSRPGQLRRTTRAWSSSTGVPDINIIPPSRSESSASNQTIATIPHLLSPEHAFHPMMLPESDVPGGHPGQFMHPTPEGLDDFYQTPPFGIQNGQPPVHPSHIYEQVQSELPHGFIPTSVTPAPLVPLDIPTSSNIRERAHTPAIKHPLPQRLDLSIPGSLHSMAARPRDAMGVPMSDESDPLLTARPNGGRRSSEDDYFTHNHHSPNSPTAPYNQFLDPASVASSVQPTPRTSPLPERRDSSHSIPRPSSRPITAPSHLRSPSVHALMQSRAPSRMESGYRSRVSSGSSSSSTVMTPPPPQPHLGQQPGEIYAVSASPEMEMSSGSRAHSGSSRSIQKMREQYPGEMGEKVSSGNRLSSRGY